jgi:hypothetical protein
MGRKMGREKIAWFLLVLFLSTAFAGKGIQIDDEMRELRGIVRDGTGVLEAVLGFFQAFSLADQVASVNALRELYHLEKYREPAHPETHVQEYFSVYGEELPETEENVLRAWQYISLAKKEKAEAMRECVKIERFDSCLVLTERMTTHLMQGNKEAASAAKNVFESVSQDLKELERMGANCFYYHGPAYWAYRNASQKLVERKGFNGFFDAMVEYAGLNEELMEGNAKVFLVVPETLNPLEFLREVHFDAFIKAPVGFHRPYNQLIGYYRDSGVKAMLELKEDLRLAKQSMHSHYQEQFFLAETEINDADALSKEVLEAGIQDLRKEDAVLFGFPLLHQKHEHARMELEKAKQQTSFSIFLSEDKARKEYLALATREAENAFSKSSRARLGLEETLNSMLELEDTARKECWETNVRGTDLGATTINQEIRSDCAEGDLAENIGEAVTAYARGVRKKLLFNGSIDVGQTLSDLGFLIDRMGEDLDVSSEKKFFQQLEERLEDSANLDLPERLGEMSRINQDALDLKQRLIERARQEYGGLEEAFLASNSTKYSGWFPLDWEERAGSLSEMRDYFERELGGLPAARVFLRYVFLETPSCNEKTSTVFVIELENPFSRPTRESTFLVESVPGRLDLNNLSAFYENGFISIETPPLNAKTRLNTEVTGVSFPLECKALESQALKELNGYLLVRKRVRIKAGTFLPNATVDFGLAVVDSPNGTAMQNSVFLENLEKGESVVVADCLEGLKDNEEEAVVFEPEKSFRENQEKNFEPVLEKTGGSFFEGESVDFTGVNFILEKLSQASQTEVGFEHNVSVWFTREDLDNYFEREQRLTNQEEVDFFYQELKGVWEKLMKQTKKEVEEAKALEGVGDSSLNSLVENAEAEYLAGNFNKAFILARHAINSFKEKSPATSLTLQDAAPVAVVLAALGLMVFFFRKEKSDSSQQNHLFDLPSLE